ALACAVGGGCSSSVDGAGGGGGASSGISTSSSSTAAQSTPASSGAGASTDDGGSGAGETSTTTGPPAPCGNGIREPGEACDGDDFGGLSCADLFRPLATGTLGCSAKCTLDTSACENWPQRRFAGHNRSQTPSVAADPNPACSLGLPVRVVAADGTLY